MFEEYDVIDILQKKLEEIERQAGRLRAAIEVLCDNSVPKPTPPSTPGNTFQTNGGVIPPISDIVRFMGDPKQPSPVSQTDIIRFVGEMRAKRYPMLSNHYNNVWRALEYHIRHGKTILCVDEEGQPAELKPLPKRNKGKKLPDSPELYEQENWFVLKEKDAEEGPRPPRGLSLFKQEER